MTGTRIQRRAGAPENSPQICVHRWWLSVFVLAAAFVVLSAGKGRSESAIVLAPGDTISYSVIGTPEFDRVSTIGLNGQLQLPFVGWVDAAGLTIGALRHKVASAVNDTPVRAVGSDGQEIWRRISKDLLFIDVATYRPIYLMGDVRENGEQPYRPGITLRQAVARAGGLGVPLNLPDSDTQLVSLSTERDMLVGEIDFVKATLARLEADLAAIGNETAAETADVSTHEDGAARWLESRSAERQLSRGNSELLVQQMTNRLEVLEELLRTHQENLSIEQDALERIQALADRGLTPASNVTEARRVVLQVSMQALETSGEVHRLQLDLARTSDEVTRLQHSQRAELLGQIVNNTASRKALERRLAALDRRLATLGGQPLTAQGAPSYRIEIHRPAGDSIQSDQLNDIKLLPGDVVEVRTIFDTEFESAATQ